jgi:hypothetical protein
LVPSRAAFKAANGRINALCVQEQPVAATSCSIIGSVWFVSLSDAAAACMLLFHIVPVCLLQCLTDYGWYGLLLQCHSKELQRQVYTLHTGRLKS